MQASARLQARRLAPGWVRLDYLVPARGLIGFRTEFGVWYVGLG